VTELVAIGWMTAAGAGLLAPLWSRLRWGLAWLALPIGAGGFALASLTVLAIGVPLSLPVSLGLTGAAGLAVALATMRRRVGALASWPTATATIGATVGLGWVFQHLHLTRLTVDSIRYLLTAEVISATGSLDAVSPWDLRMRHLVTPLLHLPGALDGPGYSAAMTPLFAVCGLGATAWFSRQAFERFAVPPRLQWMLLGTMGLLLITTNRFTYHALYINGHMFFAVLLVIGVGLGFLAIGEEDPRWILPASIASAAIVPLRPEAAIVVAIFMVPLLVSDRVSYGARWRLLIPTVAASTLWHGLLWPDYALDRDLGIAGPVYGMLFVTWGIAAGLGLLAIPAIRRHARWGPVAVLAAVAAYVAVQTVADPDLFRDNLTATAANLAVEGLWGAWWWVTPFLVLGAWLIVSSASPVRLLITSAATFALALPAFSFLRGGAYRVGTGDSGNRMLVHVTLVIAMTILFAAAEASAQLEPASGEAGSSDE
jgi:hypothetical protein